MNDLLSRATRFVVAAVEQARALHRSPLAPDVARLHRLFTSERAERRPDYQRDPALRRAYLGFFLPHNAVKIALLLERSRREGLLAVGDAPAILDVGAGPLTGIFGAWIAFGRLGRCVAVDAAAATMEAALPLLALVQHDGVERRTANVAVSPAARWLGDTRPDLVILANVLNELRDPRRGADTRERLLFELLAAVPPNGRVLVVEPATRVHGRALMLLRDRLVDGRRASVLSPCRGAPACPLLRRRGDWCHGELAWQPPREFGELARAAGIDKATLKESHLVLSPRSTPPPHAGARLVGGLMRDAAGVERRYGCGADGLLTLVGTPALPSAVAAAERGELLHPLPASARIEVTPSPAPGAPTARRGAGRPGRRGRAAGGPRPR
ncbi:MAG: hypothetical protein HYS27_25680 [Deltaproteobacteria bacterium]|nr:hypothetical protein [Deltaproteobacteria bacterium]